MKYVILCTLLAGSVLSSACSSGGLHPVMVNGKYGYIDRSGKVVVTPQFDRAGDFSDSLAAVSIGGKWGYMERSGKLAITPQFDLADRFSPGDGLAVVGSQGML